jgi:ADP-ribosylglycohydrolase
MNQYYPGFMYREFTPGKFDETCQGTVPLCLQIVCNSHGFEDAIRRAISWGGDSDTIGAIVGSIAEARWGVPYNIYTFALGYLHFDMREVIRKFNKYINNK